MPWRCVDRRPWALSLRRRSISMYTLCPPHGVDRRWSLRSSSAFWMSGLHAALLAVPHRHATVRSRRQCRESSLTVDPHPRRRRLLARDHGIGRVRRGCRPSATKPGGEQQAFRRVSCHRISTTLVVGGRLGAPSPFPNPPFRRSSALSAQGFLGAARFIVLLLEFRLTLNVIARILREVVNRVKLGDQHA